MTFFVRHSAVGHSKINIPAILDTHCIKLAKDFFYFSPSSSTFGFSFS
jgi:hypothetical protein